MSVNIVILYYNILLYSYIILTINLHLVTGALLTSSVSSVSHNMSQTGLVILDDFPPLLISHSLTFSVKHPNTDISTEPGLCLLSDQDAGLMLDVAGRPKLSEECCFIRFD